MATATKLAGMAMQGAWACSAREGERDAHLGHGGERPEAQVHTVAWLSGGGDATAARSGTQRGRESTRRAPACSAASREGRAATHHGEMAAITMNGGGGELGENSTKVSALAIIEAARVGERRRRGWCIRFIGTGGQRTSVHGRARAARCGSDSSLCPSP
jgi:hypothetical protein